MKCSRFRLACTTVVLLLTGAGSASVQEREISCGDVPAEVREAFNRSYTKATIKSCAQEVENGKTAYEIVSREGHVGRDVLFHADGTVIVVEETTALRNLPRAVKEALHRRYSDKEVELAEKVMRDGTTLYEFKIRRKRGLVEVVFNVNGHEVSP
jgi:hypothetical protein